MQIKYNLYIKISEYLRLFFIGSFILLLFIPPLLQMFYKFNKYYFIIIILLAVLLYCCWIIANFWLQTKIIKDLSVPSYTQTMIEHISFLELLFLFYKKINNYKKVELIRLMIINKATIISNQTNNKEQQITLTNLLLKYK